MKLLLNAGWDESLPLNSLDRQASDGDTDASDVNANSSTMDKKPPVIPQELPDVDAILITDSTLSSLGGLPLYFAASKDDKRGRLPRRSTSSKSNTDNMNIVDDETKKSNPPFLATYPTVKMGQMTMYDHHASLSLDGCHPGYSLEDVDAVFSKDSFVTLKYSQTLYLPLEDDHHPTKDTTANDANKSKNKLLSITPQLSGHVVGGCYYILKRLADDTQVILAPTYHHAKEKHLAGCTIHKFGVNADALLTMPGGPRGLLGKLYQPPSSRSDGMIRYYNKGKPILNPPVGNRSESELIDGIMATLRRDGNVLLPVDASGRVLELLLVLDRHWERQRLSGAYNLCWVSPMGYNTIEFARSQLEWMAEPLGAQFDSQRGHPYALKSVRICASVGELEGVIEASNGNPSVVLASGTSLDHGPARDLLLKWGENPDNLILLTDSTRCVPRGDVWFGMSRGESVDKSVVEESRRQEQETKETDEDGKLAGTAISASDVSAYTTASQLLYQWCLAKAGGEEMADEVTVDVHVPHRAALAGAELKAFLADEEAERVRVQAEMEKKAMLQEIEQAKGRLRLGEDDTGGAKGSAAAASTSKASGASSTGRPKKKSRFDQNLFIKFSKPVHSECAVWYTLFGLEKQLKS